MPTTATTTALAPRTRVTFPDPPLGRHTSDTRMLAQQQLRLLAGMTRLLSRLLHSLLWEQLRPIERRRALLLLARLEHDLSLTRVLTRSQPLQSHSVATKSSKIAPSPPQS